VRGVGGPTSGSSGALMAFAMLGAAVYRRRRRASRQ
jgi:MYXO-CTERM domain-containing protein